MSLAIEHDYRQLAADGMSRHEAISAAIERGILDGRLSLGSRLPTVRSLSSELGVSGATVAAAYGLLRRRGWTRGEVGRGTFIVGQMPSSRGTAGTSTQSAQPAPLPVPPRAPWRRRAVLSSAARLRTAYPTAIDCTSGKPDPSLFLLEAISTAWRTTIDETRSHDLQYAGPEPVAALADALYRRLDRDAISPAGSGIVIGSSAQQLMVLSLSIVPALAGSGVKTVAVEEPGYQTVFDAFAQMGFRLVGMELDHEGIVPSALEAALAKGAQAVLVTPRAQNPLGVSWTPSRRIELARVLSGYPSAVVIEDDQFADLARARPGSLLNDPRVAERVVYIRTFAKSIAPDVRVAAAVSRPRLFNLLAEAKSFTDGWSSRLSQRALARLLSDPTLDNALARVRETYERRRTIAMATLSEYLEPLGGTVGGDDGLNLWIQLSPGADAGEVIERAGAMGVICTPGEPFYIRPGRNDVLRMSISSLEETDVEVAAKRLGEAVRSTTVGHARGIPI